MNEQQQATWGKDHVLLAFPDPGLYEVRGYRHGEYEQTQPATHILQLANEEKTLCGKDASDWQPFKVLAKDFDIEDWSPKDFEGLEASNRPCKSCAQNMKRKVF